MANSLDALTGMEIAVVGMAGRFPGARDLHAFWRDLRDGVESIRFPDDEELRAQGLSEEQLRDPRRVKAVSMMEGTQEFAAAFFGYTPREAELMDPQQRVLLEVAWQALEDAGYAPQRTQEVVGVFAGASTNTYLLFNLGSNPQLLASLDQVQIDVGNGADYVATRVSYKLNLTGPSYTVQTACSTSLTALHVACQNLLDEECDIALAGGAAIHVQHPQGYRYLEGGIVSPDGHCRAFDAQAGGTVFGSGVGMVVLRRLEDALASGDHIRAVILGSAINNDGELKVGYTAPSVVGQASVIAEAMAAADVAADSISYVEAHGTGTKMGDPIEIRALTKAYRAHTQACGYCAIGSVKTNIGHLSGAAGISGFIKTVLALENRQIPPSLHFTQPNPEIDFAASPFFVNAELRDWEPRQGKRRAAVSAFGVGGTNVHVILEEAPACEPSEASRPAYLLPLSAKTPGALDALTHNLAEHLRLYPDLNLADVAYTLRVGRREFPERRMVVGSDRESLLAALDAPAASPGCSARTQVEGRPVAFMFSGQGAQYVNMAQGFYRSEPCFREHVDRCAELLRPHLGLDLRELLYPQPGQEEAAAERLKQTAITQPALFTLEYALAQLWLSWGVRPAALIGHSIGEYAAACLSGVFSLEDALALVAARGRLMQALPAGSMLVVMLAAAELEALLGPELSLAAANGPTMSVASGPTAAIDALEARLAERQVVTRRLRTSHAFHSAMMDPILEPFIAEVRKFKLHPPQIPCISNVSGTWLTDDQALDHAYWAQHLRQGVRFNDGVQTLLQRDPAQVLLELGPGNGLARLARPHVDTAQSVVPVACVRHPREQQPDGAFLLGALGQLWLAGVSIDWAAFYAGERRLRLPLPTYSFERRRFWIEPGNAAALPRGVHKRADLATWFYAPVWKSSPPLLPLESAPDDAPCWVFADDYGVGDMLAVRLRAAGQRVVMVREGECFAQLAVDVYTVNPGRAEDYATLLEHAGAPGRVLHLWSITSACDVTSDAVFFERSQDMGFYSLLFLIQTLNPQDAAQPLALDVFSDHLFAALPGDCTHPEKSPLLGLVQVAAQEYAGLTFRAVDIQLPEVDSSQWERLGDCLLADLATPSPDVPALAYRSGLRWIPDLAAFSLPEAAATQRELRDAGVYLIIGAPEEPLLAPLVAALRAKGARVALLLPEGAVCDEPWGADVLVRHAAWSDAAQVSAILDEVDAHCGALHGVFFMPGFNREALFHAVSETDRALCDSYFATVVLGLYALREALHERTLDFCLLSGSLATELGGYGLSLYAAANHFAAAFAQQQSARATTLWIYVAWDAWRFESQAATATMSAELAELAMSETEGLAALERILGGCAVARVAVSTGDLAARVLQARRRDAATEMGSGATHARPDLQTAYVAPGSPLEKQISAIWEQVLGIQEIGLHDDFFDLGGHSLLATQLRNQLYEKFKVDLPIRSLFDNATVAGIAALISQSRAQSAPDDSVALEERLRTAFPTDRPAIVEAYLRRKIAQGLNLAPDDLPESGDLRAYDLELVAVDLMWNLKRDLSLQLYPHEIMARPALAEMTSFVLEESARLADLPSQATTLPLDAFALKPYSRRSGSAAVAASAEKNPRMVFLHSSPRAGSTLLRVMLGGHAGLFCPPELNLLFFETMEEWRSNLGFGHDFQWTAQGLHWAFVELLEMETQEGWDYLDHLVAENRSTRVVYKQLQSLAGERLLVDKTPPYALDMETLQRAEMMFEQPKYIFLTRHPYAVMDSLLRARFDRLFAKSLFDDPSVDPYVVVEAVWALCNRNLLNFFAQVAPERYHHVRYEDLVRDPRSAMLALGEFLELPFDEALLAPYDGRRERMMGGLGDPNILLHQRIDPSLGEVWKHLKFPRALDASTQELAQQLGYTLPELDSVPTVVPDAGAEASANLDGLSDEDVYRLLNDMLEED